MPLLWVWCCFYKCNELLVNIFLTQQQIISIKSVVFTAKGFLLCFRFDLLFIVCFHVVNQATWVIQGLRFPSYLGQCRRGRQTSAICSATAGWGPPPAGQASSGWRTVPHCRWGNWAWQMRCAEHHRTRSRCSWTSCRRIQRWRTPRGRTESKLQGQQSTEEHKHYSSGQHVCTF